MPNRNRELGSDQADPQPANFNPGGEDFGILRTIDGHQAMGIGLDAANIHQPSAPDMDWSDVEPYINCE